MSTIHKDFISGIGNTPLIKLRAASEITGCNIYGKAEFMNPGGSVKDRAALALIKDAESKKLISKGGTIVEGTAGNTGIGLCLLGNSLGYKTIIVMNDNQTQEKKDLLRNMGADLRLVPAKPYKDEANFVKVAAKLAVGYTLDELPNDITGKTLAAYEPTIDYIVTKVPRFDFEKFPSASGHLGVQMQSVGEVMAIGRTFRESLQKAFRSLEVGVDGLEPKWAYDEDPDLIRARSFDLTSLRFATAFRLLKIREAFLSGKTIEEVFKITKIDIWFLNQIKMRNLTSSLIHRISACNV